MPAAAIAIVSRSVALLAYGAALQPVSGARVGVRRRDRGENKKEYEDRLAAMPGAGNGRKPVVGMIRK